MDLYRTIPEASRQEAEGLEVPRASKTLYLIKEYALNPIRDPIMIQDIFLTLGGFGVSGIFAPDLNRRTFPGNRQRRCRKLDSKRSMKHCRGLINWNRVWGVYCILYCAIT